MFQSSGLQSTQILASRLQAVNGEIARYTALLQWQTVAKNSSDYHGCNLLDQEHGNPAANLLLPQGSPMNAAGGPYTTASPALLRSRGRVIASGTGTATPGAVLEFLGAKRGRGDGKPMTIGPKHHLYCFRLKMATGYSSCSTFQFTLPKCNLKINFYLSGSIILSFRRYMLAIT